MKILKAFYEHFVAGFYAGGCVSITDSGTSLLASPLVKLAYLWSFGNFLYKLVVFLGLCTIKEYKPQGCGTSNACMLKQSPNVQ